MMGFSIMEKMESIQIKNLWGEKLEAQRLPESIQDREMQARMSACNKNLSTENSLEGEMMELPDFVGRTGLSRYLSMSGPKPQKIWQGWSAGRTSSCLWDCAWLSASRKTLILFQQAEMVGEWVVWKAGWLSSSQQRQVEGTA